MLNIEYTVEYQSKQYPFQICAIDLHINTTKFELC